MISPPSPQNLQYQLASLWTASHTPNLGYLHSHGSLPLSLWILIGPRIKKQRTWLGATPTAGNEKQGKMGWDLSHKLWKGELCKATPRLREANPGIPSKMLEVPTPRQQCLPHCPGKTNRRGRSMRSQHMGKGGSYLISEVGATALPEHVLGAGRFTSIPSILSKNCKETKNQKAWRVTSKHTELKNRTTDLNPKSIQKLPTALHGLDRISSSRGNDVYRSSPYIIQTRSVQISPPLLNKTMHSENPLNAYTQI